MVRQKMFDAISCSTSTIFCFMFMFGRSAVTQAVNGKVGKSSKKTVAFRKSVNNKHVACLSCSLTVNTSLVVHSEVLIADSAPVRKEQLGKYLM